MGGGDVKIYEYSDLHLGDDSAGAGLRNYMGYGGLTIDYNGNVSIEDNYNLILGNGTSSYGLRNYMGSGGLTIDSSGNVKIDEYSSLYLGDDSLGYGLRNYYGSGGLNIDFNGNVVVREDLIITGNNINSSDESIVMTLDNDDVTFADDVTVSGDVNISSDARLKSNIVSLGATLSKILLIDGKSYEMKGKQKIGVLAQDIQEAFPELVSEDENKMLSVNYQGLVPVLINAIKEQEDKISRLENLVEQLISKK
jgi:hypothetical protein